MVCFDRSAGHGRGHSRRHRCRCSVCTGDSRYDCQHDLVTNVDGGAIVLKELTATGENFGQIGNRTHRKVPESLIGM